MSRQYDTIVVGAGIAGLGAAAILSREAGRRLHEAFELRQKADYRDFWEVDGEQAREILQAAEDFVREARTILEP